MSQTNEPQPPAGWRIQAGAGGWRCVQPAKLWSTSVYQDDPEKGPGLPRAIEAAETLERKATARLEETERLCAALRKAFRDE